MAFAPNNDINNEPQENGNALEFFFCAQQIDSTLHKDLKHQMYVLRLYNALAEAQGFDELVAVGSCIDGSKVSTPGDGGDIDVLLMPTDYILEQSQFENDERYPAFLRVKLTSANAKHFENVELIDGKYLSVSVLKQISARFSSSVRLFLSTLAAQGISEDETYVNIVKHTAVGLEQMCLEFEPLKQAGVRKKTSEHELDHFKEFLCRILNVSIDWFGQGNTTNTTEYGNDSLSISKKKNILQVIDRFVNCLKGSNGTVKDIESFKTDESDQLYCKENKNTRKDNGNGSEHQNACTIVNRNTEVTVRVLYCRTDKKKLTPTTVIQADNCGQQDTLSTPTKNVFCAANLTYRQNEDVNSSVTQENANVNSVLRENILKEDTIPKQNDTDTQNKKEVKTINVDQICRHKTLTVDKYVSTDFVPAFKFKGWPAAANEWPSRSRKWPSADVVQKVLETGCQIVAKRPLLPNMDGDPKNEDHSPEHDRLDPYFRLSFSRCEVVLSHSLNVYQLLVWRILKAYQKSFLNTTPRVLASYHWKNVAFWIFEETDVDTWTEIAVLPTVCKAIDLMLLFLRKKNIPQYFVRACNLIDGCREDKITEVFERIRSIRKSPLFYLKEFLSNLPTAEQHTVESSTIDDLLKHDLSKKHIEKYVDDLFDSFESQTRDIKKGCLPYRNYSKLKDVIKAMKELFGEVDSSNSSPDWSCLDHVENAWDSILNESKPPDLPKFKTCLNGFIDSVSSHSKKKSETQMKRMVPRFKEVFNLVFEGSNDIENKMQSLTSEVCSCAKASLAREQETDNGSNVKLSGAEAVIDSLQEAMSVVFNPTERNSFPERYGDLLKSVANLEPPKPKPEHKKEVADIDLD